MGWIVLLIVAFIGLVVLFAVAAELVRRQLNPTPDDPPYSPRHRRG